MVKLIVRSISLILITIIATVFPFTDFVYATNEATQTQVSQQILKGITAHSSHITVSLVSDTDDSLSMVKGLFNSAIEMSPIADYYQYSVCDGYSVRYSCHKEKEGLCYELDYRPKYKLTKSQEKTFEKDLKKVIKKLHLKGKSKKVKTKLIYQYITSHVKYCKKDKTSFTAYGALHRKKAVCQGCAALFYRMCKKAGIKVEVIVGTSHGGSHMWNIVEINHKYYNMDVTWDIGHDSHHFKYFLKKNKNFKNHLRDAEFRTIAFNKSHPMAR